MDWHLNIKISDYPFKIEHHQKIFTMGSCFAENIANWLKERHFNVYSNPNGVLFNPESVLINLKNILDNPKYFDEKFLLENKGIWKSFLHPTYFSNKNKKEFLETIIQTQLDARQFLIHSDFLIISFGSAFVYVHKELNEIVANCHKLPNQLFEKKLLGIQQIVEAFSDWINELNKINPPIKIILSVSPVKYLSYGAEQNNISKSVLILSVHKLCENFSNVFYFPAYEWVTDDLRDYRFYKEDMAHPNDTAIQYVMEKFSAAMLSESTKKLSQEIEKIISATQHKIIDTHSDTLIKFSENMIKLCKLLENQTSYLNFEKEKRYFEQLQEIKK